jgi:hypothetical protein
LTSLDERRIRILAEIGGEPGSRQLCEVSAKVLKMNGAGIMLMADDGPHGSACSTDEVSALIEDLQHTLGEGPCVDAYHQQRPVLEPDLVSPAAPRWLGFTAPVVAAGARAVFGFPLQTGSVRLGALNLYRTERGPLTGDQHADALVMADVATRALLEMQADAPRGRLAAGIDDGANLEHVVHQAAGMVSVQLVGTIADALLRLRAHAFGNDRSLTEVAQDVVARRLRFDRRLDGEDQDS